MQLHIGTSGFAYKEWKGRFYPEDLPASRMLRYYGERFGAVEINNTFYRLPKASVLQAWASEVPGDFKFVLKASRRITHMQRFRHTDESLVYLLETSGVLGERLGALLFQAPPDLKKDLPRLADFLAMLPPGRRMAFEFRHASWLDDEVFDLLRRHGVALCVVDSDEQLEVPLVATADWGYLRLRRLDYDEARLSTWTERIEGQAWREAFVFFKHEDEARGPALATRFQEMTTSRVLG